MGLHNEIDGTWRRRCCLSSVNFCQSISDNGPSVSMPWSMVSSGVSMTGCWLMVIQWDASIFSCSRRFCSAEICKEMGEVLGIIAWSFVRRLVWERSMVATAGGHSSMTSLPTVQSAISVREIALTWPWLTRLGCLCTLSIGEQVGHKWRGSETVSQLCRGPFKCCKSPTEWCFQMTDSCRYDCIFLSSCRYGKLCLVEFENIN